MIPDTRPIAGWQLGLLIEVVDLRAQVVVYDRETKRTLFAVEKDGDVSLAAEIEGEDGTHLVPIPASNSLIRNEAIMLPSCPAEYGSTAELAEDIGQYLDRYVSMSDWFRQTAIWYVMFTWLFDAFQELPYLRLLADYGSGKTRALIVIGSICNRAFFASGASSVSSVFHTLNTFRGTLILDEADFRFSDQTAEVVKILNAGHTQGFPVFRTIVTKDREFNPRAFHVYGPKLVAMRRPFADAALESRFLTERLSSPLRPGVPINLPASQKAEALALRNKLLKFRFDTWKATEIVDGLYDSSLSPRTNQILIPLLSIIPDPAVRATIKEAMIAQEEERRGAASATIEAQLVEVLCNEERIIARKPVPITDIAEQYAKQHGADTDRPVTPRYIGSILRNHLGFLTYKTGGIYVVTVNTERLTALKARYGIGSSLTQR